MPSHLLAYYNSSVATSLTDVPALTDGVIPVSNFGITAIPPRAQPADDLHLVAAAAVSSTLQRVRVYTDAMRPFGPLYVRPPQASGAAVGPLFPENPRLMTLFHTPILLPRSEQIHMEAVTGAPGGEPFLCLLWVASHLQPFPAAGTDLRWVRYTNTDTVAANAWFRLTSANTTFEQSLPGGTYAVLGMEHFSASAQAARLAFAGQSERPGVIAMNGGGGFAGGVTGRNHSAFYDGSFGVFGQFQNGNWPGIEVLCNGADTSAEGYLLVAKVA